jgi:hypothetical protein
VTTRRLGQTILIFIPLVICAARLHASASGTPRGVTQEIARCLNIVRVAVARRTGKENAHAGSERPQAARGSRPLP